MNGREMVNCIVQFFAVRDEYYQFYDLRDIMSITLECKEKDLDERFPSWFDTWRDIYHKTNTNEFSPQMKLIVLQHFHEQFKKVPMLYQIMSMYYFSEDAKGTGIKTYKWLESKIIEL